MQVEGRVVVIGVVIGGLVVPSFDQLGIDHLLGALEGPEASIHQVDHRVGPKHYQNGQYQGEDDGSHLCDVKFVLLGDR